MPITENSMKNIMEMTWNRGLHKGVTENQYEPMSTGQNKISTTLRFKEIDGSDRNMKTTHPKP